MLIETIPAAFEMDEILYELREHSAGLNAGRWDYIFSIIKTFRSAPSSILPDRAKVTMTVPFMRAYTELLVQTCHQRGALAMGGMAAFIPSRNDPEVNERAFDAGRAPTRSARRATASTAPGSRTPTRSPVAMEEFDAVLGERPNQIDKQRPDVHVDGRGAAGRVLAPGDDARRTACARTSTSASSTSPPGCAATARPGSTT